MRLGDSVAVAEFLRRFRPMIRAAAKRLEVPLAEREPRIEQFLEDAALALMGDTGEVPRAVRGYLVRCFTNLCRNARRDAAREDERLVGATLTGDVHHEGAVVGLASEHALRSSSGPEADAPDPDGYPTGDESTATLAPALERLASVIEDGLTEEERLLLVWVGNYVPYQEIADWLDVSYKAVCKRVERLRARLQEAAAAYAAHLTSAEREELLVFFRRTTAVARLMAAGDDTGVRPRPRPRRRPPSPGDRATNDAEDA